MGPNFANMTMTSHLTCSVKHVENGTCMVTWQCQEWHHMHQRPLLLCAWVSRWSQGARWQHASAQGAMNTPPKFHGQQPKHGVDGAHACKSHWFTLNSQNPAPALVRSWPRPIPYGRYHRVYRSEGVTCTKPWPEAPPHGQGTSKL